MQPTHIFLFEILIKTVQDNNISGFFLLTVLPLSVVISASATRQLPVIPVPVSITAITLFMNDRDYLVVFENKKILLMTRKNSSCSSLVPWPWILKNLEMAVSAHPIWRYQSTLYMYIHAFIQLLWDIQVPLCISLLAL